MKYCKKCKKELAGDLLVRKNGYTRGDCRLCLNKKSREHGRKIAETKKKYKVW